MGQEKTRAASRRGGMQTLAGSHAYRSNGTRKTRVKRQRLRSDRGAEGVGVRFHYTVMQWGRKGRYEYLGINKMTLS